MQAPRTSSERLAWARGVWEVERALDALDRRAFEDLQRDCGRAGHLERPVPPYCEHLGVAAELALRIDGRKPLLRELESHVARLGVEALGVRTGEEAVLKARAALINGNPDGG